MSSLFNNPMVNSAKQSMTENLRKEYENIGEEMYSTVNFEENKIISENTLPDGYTYIKQLLQSGLKISDLDPEDEHIIELVEGYEWKQNYAI
jgi:hypothetical protein